MSNQTSSRQDHRNIFQKTFGILLLEKCPKCHSYSFSAANYGEGGHCSVCGHTTPRVIMGRKKD